MTTRNGWVAWGAFGVFAVQLAWNSQLLAQADNDFEEWQQNDLQVFQQFKDEHDRQFLEFLQKDWREWQGFQGIVSDKVPKPVESPVSIIAPSPPPPPIPSPMNEKPGHTPGLPPVETERLPEPAEPVPEAKPLEVGPKEQREPKLFEVSFFGMDWRMSNVAALEVGLGAPLDKDAISAFWKAMSLTPYEDCLAQVQEIRARMGLNDWGYYQLLQQIGSSLYGTSQNQATLFVWFMLCKSGYQAKVGYDRDQVCLLLPSEQPLYSTAYFTFGDIRFYNLAATSGKTPSLYTYEGNYPGADKRLDLRVSRPPTISGGMLAKTLKFAFEGREYQVPVRLERGAVEFFSHYPQTEFEVYFDASPSPEAKNSLVQALKPAVAGRSETDAVNLLLCFVQTAFDYQVDDQQFGQEKPLFLEETLFYPYSDCEDRSILFAYLVRELLGLEVIGLDYPGHVATAVGFNKEVPGDFVLYQGKKFSICDPTYINATLGTTMPQFRGVDPGVIRIRG